MPQFLLAALSAIKGMNPKQLGTYIGGLVLILVIFWAVPKILPNYQLIRNQEIAECNETQLEEALAQEQAARLKAEELAEGLKSQLSDALAREAEARRFISDVDEQLDELELDDGPVAPRTKELLKRLNARTEGLLVENTDEEDPS